MPFGLSNALNTFQATMNQLFQPLLQKFVIVFFDDIWFSVRLRVLMLNIWPLFFHLLWQHSFFVKEAKCSFGLQELAYCGHFISIEGVWAYSDKVVTVVDWPQPKTVKQIHTFLGLMGYYQKFVAQYAQISMSLTDLLRKDHFWWPEVAEHAFDQLKTALTTAPILVYPNFDDKFTLETDACDVGIGTVLLQLVHTIAYFSRKLSDLRQWASTYSKEL